MTLTASKLLDKLLVTRVVILGMHISARYMYMYVCALCRTGCCVRIIGVRVR